MRIENLHSCPVQVGRNCIVWPDSGNISHKTEIAKLNGCCPRATAHDLKKNCAWSVGAESRGPENFALCRTASGADRANYKLRLSAEALADDGGRSATDAATLTLALGGDWHGRSGNAPCPVCQPERRHNQRALSLRDDGGRLLAFCHKSGCAFRDIIGAAGLPQNAVRFDLLAAREVDLEREDYAARQLARARRLWDTCKPITGTKGEAYLRGRGITCPLPASLRWADDAFHGPSARWLSAMVGDVSAGGVHRTYFEKSGERICGSAKMMQGPCAGGAVALSKARGPLVVCEGIETGLSLLSGLLSHPAGVWAALSTSGMKALDLPEKPERMMIAADGDLAGKEAAAFLATRATALGWKVSLLVAPDGRDWNDVLTEKGGAI